MSAEVPPPPPELAEDSGPEVPDSLEMPDLDSGTDPDSDDEVEPVVDAEKAEAALLKAVGLKDAGNDFLKAGNLEQAVRSYRRGTAALRGMNEGNTGDEQTKALLISLSNNMAMVMGKQGKWLEAIKVSKEALKVDATNLKALFRTAVGQRETGNLDEAKATLRKALDKHPDSRECKLELAKIKKAEAAAKQKEKAMFSGTFGKGGGMGSL
ncbi:hypothetical protein TeGR_g4260 [Tetraparma gracilis]|uniref:peptidylprolyl isomerase n=1 Tax=Tetraparma gracilis TaxID=2962635 RepID=A0ABQ6MBK3_9STRA|nr:hypothetical protein TeGR_g4260 [Tetraparma gracilis]